MALELSSNDFTVNIDDETGAILEILDAQADSGINWISGPSNAPWQPTGSRWGLGFANIGGQWLNRAYWTDPEVSNDGSSSQATYDLGPLRLSVSRRVDSKSQTFTETYSFTNTGTEDLNLASGSATAVAIYTPFNDHYTNSTDSLNTRTHAHVWANGGSSSWVKLDRMGGAERNLGLVLTKGSLAGYSIESRDRISYSNTRGVFLLHPSLPTLAAQETADLEWTFFWHGDWDDFLTQCEARSDQFINFKISSHTIVPNENATIDMSGASINEETTVNGNPVQCSNASCRYILEAGNVGEKALEVATTFNGETWNSTIFLNSVPSYDDLISARVQFIAENQQVSDPDSPLDNAYIVYDNQMGKMVTFDTERDRNAGRERIGMGVLMARWLSDHSDSSLQDSLIRYYEFVCTELQDETGFVLDGPGSRIERLYNWPWVMQLHLIIASLDLNLPDTLADRSPLERFLLTLESFYSKGGEEFYPIGLPILEGLRALADAGDVDALELALSHFTRHGEHIVDVGLDYPASEVNFEQSIVGPAATILLELYRWTEEEKWLEAAEVQMEALLRFGGKQPDYRVHNVAIRHWDGYWFGKDRMWGDTFPHYWSAITAIALHHHGKATNDSSLENQANGIIRANFALFTPEGAGSCAWLYPLSVNSRDGHYADPYANDQDWALAFLLQMQADNAYEQK